MIEIIKKGDIISITGAGGKTSLMFYLGKKLVGKKVITTTTKIFKPESHEIILNESFSFTDSNQTIVTANELKDNKLVGINKYCFDSDYDYILIEADGSKTLSLKGYSSNEPVICSNNTKTIGVIDITTIGLNASYDNIFRIDELKKITNLQDTINLENLSDLVINKNGIFKNSNNIKVLFITKCESTKDTENAKKLADIVKDNVDYIFIGSVKEEKFLRIK